ncbi:uncharacterized protein EV154DRAFT_593751 [Mucor mucedo]|uniref:uncharacterized protein n=1 Tax=Mucor mucedo TaxID=29922 RepID=UPI00221F9207|nr:uncharacterized protein EV154DRAFT_593751 [Mucor mucedo]KAI7888460.1 hypothetical protein EV154DRAFT_593751 [Mucor mucedo]
MALSHFEESAQTGNEYGQLFAGLLHAVGFGDTEQNRVKSFTYFQQAATQWKNPIALYAMGMQYLTGRGVPHDPQLALNTLTLAAESGWTEAKLQLGHEYHHGRHGIPADTALSLYWYMRVIDQNHTCNRNSLFLFGNIDIRIDFELHEDTIQLAQPIRSMYRESPLHLHDEFDPSSHLYYWDTMCNDPSVALTQSHVGIGLVNLATGTDLHICLENWKFALKGVSPIASYYLGVLYKRGLGVPIDYLAAARFFKQASDWGYDLALYELGYVYHKGGHGLGFDNDKAFQTFVEYVQLKKDQVNIKTYYYMACICEDGSARVPCDYKKALLFYKKAYKMGYGGAADAIGRMYKFGLGMPAPNMDKAHEWYSKALALGFEEAHQGLGQLYLDGYVKGPDGLQLALKHFMTAFETGYEPAGAMIQYINDRLQTQGINFY